MAIPTHFGPQSHVPRCLPDTFLLVPQFTIKKSQSSARDAARHHSVGWCWNEWWIEPGEFFALGCQNCQPNCLLSTFLELQTKKNPMSPYSLSPRKEPIGQFNPLRFERISISPPVSRNGGVEIRPPLRPPRSNELAQTPPTLSVSKQPN